MTPPTGKPRPSSYRSAGSVFNNKTRDWAAAMGTLRTLHRRTAADPNSPAAFDFDLHESIHDLARFLGAPDGWLHEEGE